MKSYEKHTLLTLVFRIALFVILFGSVSTGSFLGLIPMVLIIPVCVREMKTSKLFPQWGISPFKLPIWIVAVFCVLVVGSVVISFITDFDYNTRINTFIVVAILLADPAYNLYYVRKYHLDKYSCVTELLREHPEALPKLNRSLSACGSVESSESNKGD